MPTAEEIAQKQFDEDDKRWTAPKFISLGAVTLFIAISLIYAMSTTTGCSLQSRRGAPSRDAARGAVPAGLLRKPLRVAESFVRESSVSHERSGVMSSSSSKSSS